MSNNEYSARFVSVVSVRADTFRGVRFGCVKSLPVSACKVINLKPTKQIILEKYFLKNCKRTNKAFFVRLWCARRLVQICHKHSVLYMYVRARVRICVR